MFGIGTSEIILIFTVALVVFGPNKIPEIARLLAKATRMFQEASRELQRQLEMSEWDKEITPKPKKDSEASSTEVVPGYQTEASAYQSPYDYGTSETSSITDPYSANQENMNASSAPGEEMVMEAQSIPVEEIEIDPAKVDDADRAARELRD